MESFSLSTEKFDRLKAQILLWCSVVLTLAFYWINLAVDVTTQEYLIGRLVTVAVSVIVLICFNSWWGNLKLRYKICNGIIFLHLWYSFVSANLSNWNDHYRMLWICEAAILSVSTFRFRDFLMIAVLSLVLPWVAVAQDEVSVATIIQLDSIVALILLVIGVSVRSNHSYRNEITLRSQQAIQSSKMASLGQMAAGLAHEINNPLAIIRGLSDRNIRDLNSGKFDTTKALVDLEKIVSTTERIAKIIRSLKAISRNSENDPFLPVSLKSIIEGALELSREKFKLSSVDLQITGNDNVLLECSDGQISQVLVNLLNNAHDAVINLHEKWIKIIILTDNDKLLLRVVDSGTGINASHVSRISEPFFTTKEPGKGTGLGLSISRSIAERHSGKLYYQLYNGHTSFVLELPLKQKNH